MSDETRKDEDGAEVEGHGFRIGANDEPAAEGEGDDEVEGHMSRAGAPRIGVPKSG